MNRRFTASGRRNAGLALIMLGLLAFIALNGAGGEGPEGRFIQSAWREAARATEGALPLGVFPAVVEEAPLQVREAYALASEAGNQVLLQSLNCYCGCASGLGHESLFHCFIKQLPPGDMAVYSNHGVGCFTGQSELRDAAEWTRQGRGLPETKQLLDRKYGE